MFKTIKGMARYLLVYYLIYVPRVMNIRGRSGDERRSCETVAWGKQNSHSGDCWVRAGVWRGGGASNFWPSDCEYMRRPTIPEYSMHLY